MNDPFNVAVIGTGYWGKHYVRILGSQCKLAVDQSITARERMVSLYPHLETSASLNDALINADVHALIVVTPAATHYTVVKSALLSGKHVLVEKPLTLTSQHAKELLS